MKSEYDIIGDESLKKLELKLRKEQFGLIQPLRKNLKQIINIIKKYIIEKKLILYGGTALDMLLKDKGEQGIYTDAEINLDIMEDYRDIEFYSYEPIKDLKNICDIVFKKGIEGISGHQATHPGTYTIRFWMIQVCDITYVPKYICDNFPFKYVKKIKLVHPSVMLIDKYRIRTNILGEARSLYKTIKRQHCIEKLLHIKGNKPKFPNFKFNKRNSKLIPNVISLLIKNKDIIFVGLFGINCLLKSSGNIELKKFSKNIKVNQINIICKDVLSIIRSIEKKFKKEKLVFKEYVPFFQFYGTMVTISLKGEKIPFIRIFELNQDVKVCTSYTPYTDVLKNNYRIGSVDLFYVYFYSWKLYSNIYKNKEFENICDYIIKLLKYAQNIITNTSNNLLNNKSFKILSTNCFQLPTNGLVENQKNNTKLKKNKKKIFILRYFPDASDKIGEKYFDNSSGNIVKQFKYLKYLNKVVSEKDFISF